MRNVKIRFKKIGRGFVCEACPAKGKGWGRPIAQVKMDSMTDAGVAVTEVLEVVDRKYPQPQGE